MRWTTYLKISFLCLVLLLLGCVHTRYVPQPLPPPIAIEQPPELEKVKWVLLEIDGAKYYGLSEEEAIKLIINVELLKEYADRCYLLIESGKEEHRSKEEPHE